MKVGDKYIFNYPKEFVTLPDYTEHRGQIVVITGFNLDVDEEVEAVVKIRAEDGWEGEAYHSELELE